MTSEEAIELMGGELTKEQAAEVAASEWWKGLDARTVARAQLDQRRTCMPFGEYHKAVEEAVGEPVPAHELVEGGQRIVDIRAALLAAREPAR